MSSSHTILGRDLPAGAGAGNDSLPPTLLFHRWHAYDDIDADEQGKPVKDCFKTTDAGKPFLERVARDVQAANRSHYQPWHQRFVEAFDVLQCEMLPASTLWRMAVGWGTNPAWETGLVLDHFLGFPLIPGSAVKGLIHRVAEQSLFAPCPKHGEAALPLAPEPGGGPATPPAELQQAIRRALRIRVLFGSLHLDSYGGVFPESPKDRLNGWKSYISQLPDNERLPWRLCQRDLDTLCGDTHTGGMITCFDAVPARRAFTPEQDRMLQVDVLTPHPNSANSSAEPLPLPFLAVRPGVPFEFRYALQELPESASRAHPAIDREQAERQQALRGWDRPTVLAQLRDWLEHGLMNEGAGGKTTAGYGYFFPEKRGFPDPVLLEPPPPLVPTPPGPIAQALEQFEAHGKDLNQAIDQLDKAQQLDNEDVLRAVAQRFYETHRTKVAKWSRSPSQAKKKRAELILGLVSKENP